MSLNDQAVEIYNDTSDAKEALKPIFHRLNELGLNKVGDSIGDAMCSIDEAMGDLREWIEERVDVEVSE